MVTSCLLKTYVPLLALVLAFTSFTQAVAANKDSELDPCSNVLLFVHPKEIRDATFSLWTDNPDPVRGAARLSGDTLGKIAEDIIFPGSFGADDRHQFEILAKVVKHPNVKEKALIGVLSFLEQVEHRGQYEIGYVSEPVALAQQIAKHPAMGEKLLGELVNTMHRASNGTPFAEALLSAEVINHPKLRPEQFILLTDHVLVPSSFTNESYFLDLLLERALILPAKDHQALSMRIEDFGKRVLLNKSQTFFERNRFTFANKLLEKAPVSQDLAHQMVLIERKWFENVGKQGLAAGELIAFAKRLHAVILPLNNEKLSALSLSIVAKYEKLETL